MEFSILIFLAGGLFLGWSLGANDAANVFGTAVGTRMVRFGTAALICSVFVILGAVISGAGAAHTLGKLGAINALAGSAVAAATAAITVFAMTRVGLPVSTSQAIVGAIIGWNLFSGFPTDSNALIKIVGTWIACPVLAAVIAAGLYRATGAALRRSQLHILRQDAYTRIGLILAGALGAYSLGANNIANVMGVFIADNPFTSFNFQGLIDFSGIEQLFLIGGIAIAVGVFTYSKRVMLTVGHSLMPMSPAAAWVVVVSHSIVLLLFASERLEYLLASLGLPTIPLVPVSSSQAVIGGVVGIGLVKGGKGIRWRVLGNIASGWVTTPLISCGICFFALFFMQNVFNQPVYQERAYELSATVMERLVEDGIDPGALRGLEGVRFDTVGEFRSALSEDGQLSSGAEAKVLERAVIDNIAVTADKLATLDRNELSAAEIAPTWNLRGRSFRHAWQLAEALAQESELWRARPDTKVNKIYNKKLQRKLDFLIRSLQNGE